MNTTSKLGWIVAAGAIALAGCASRWPSGDAFRLSETQCRDLDALARGAPITPQRSNSELAALEAAGYEPWAEAPDYPADLERAQHRVSGWRQAQCTMG